MASSGAGNLQQSANKGNDVSSQPVVVEEELWDEERLEQAMKTLKEMHIQLRGLRTTLPRLIAPLTTKQPSQCLFREFSTSANTANQEVQEFRRLVTSEDSKKVMEQARKSRADNPKGIKPWKASDHPDWLKRDA